MCPIRCRWNRTWWWSSTRTRPCPDSAAPFFWGARKRHNTTAPANRPEPFFIWPLRGNDPRRLPARGFFGQKQQLFADEPDDGRKENVSALPENDPGGKSPAMFQFKVLFVDHGYGRFGLRNSFFYITAQKSCEWIIICLVALFLKLRKYRTKFSHVLREFLFEVSLRTPVFCKAVFHRTINLTPSLTSLSRCSCKSICTHAAQGMEHGIISC